MRVWPGVNSWFGMAYDEHPPEYTELFDFFTSDKKYEEDVQVVGFGAAPVKAEGSAVTYDSLQQGYIARYVHNAVALGFIVTHEEMEDNLYMQLANQRARNLAFAMHQAKEITGANVYNNAFSSSFLGGDGAALISASHPTQNGNQSNTLSTAAQLSEAAIESLYINIQLTTDDRGLKIPNNPHCLVVPPQLGPDAYRIVQSVLQNDSANNAVNFIRSAGIFPDGIKVNRYLTNQHYWYIRTDIPDGLKYFEREAIKFTQDNDFDTENAKFKAYERYSFGWTDWRGLWGTNPT